MKRIADSGFLIALLDRLDTFHGWAAGVLEIEPPPYLVCEPVCAEVAAVLGTPRPVIEMLERGDLLLDFAMGEQLIPIGRLLRKYSDRPMDLADACVVRMSELHRVSKVLTVDVSDFTVYRRFGKQRIPCEFPPPGE